MKIQRGLASLIFVVAGGFIMNQTLGWLATEVLNWAKDVLTGATPWASALANWPTVIGTALVAIGLIVAFWDRVFPAPSEPIPDKPAEPYPDGLYVGEVGIDQDRLMTNRILEFSVACYNGTGNALTLDEVNGPVYATQMILGVPAKSFELSPVTSKDVVGRKSLPPGQAFKLTFDSSCPDTFMRAITSVDDTTKVVINLSKIEISYRSVEWPDRQIPLRLWKTASISKPTKRLLLEHRS